MQSQVPAAARRFFEFRLGRRDFNHPVIAEAFKPGAGWKRYPIKKRVSASWLRKMRDEGYTHVGLVSDGAGPVDFSIKELLSSRVPKNAYEASVFSNDWRGLDEGDWRRRLGDG